MNKLLATLFGKARMKQCSHGATSWYVCPDCKKEHPEYKPFFGEGDYDAYMRDENGHIIMDL